MSGQEVMAAQAGGNVPSMTGLANTGFGGDNLLAGNMPGMGMMPSPMSSATGFSGGNLLSGDMPNMPTFNSDGYSGMGGLPSTMTGTAAQQAPGAPWMPRLPNIGRPDFKNPLGQFALGMLQHNLTQQPQMPQYPMHNMGMAQRASNPIMGGPNMYQARPLGFRYG